MPSNSCLRLVHVKFILTHKICNEGKIVRKKSYLKDFTDGLFKKGLRHAIFVYFQKLNGVFASVEFQK